MSAQPLPDDSFVRLDAAWSSARALAILRALAPRRVVVHHRDATGERFYVLTNDDASDTLAAHPDRTVAQALTLDDRSPSPVLGSAHGRVMRPSVIREDGILLGVATPPKKHGNKRAMLHDAPPLDAVFEALRPISKNAMRGFDPSRPLDFAPPDAGVAPIGTPSLEAGTRSLVARGPEEVQVGKEAPVYVTLAVGEVTGATPFAAPDGETIYVALEASGAIDVVGPTDIPIVLDAGVDEGQRILVRGREIGQGKLAVVAYLHGRAVARAVLTTRVVAANPETAPIEATAAVVTVPQSPPDLTLHIRELPDHKYGMEVTASDADLGLNLAPFGPIALGDNAEAYFAGFYRDVEDILRSASDVATKIEKLGVKGSALAQRLVPEPLRKRLWDLRDSIKSVEIQSAEPWVPWELCQLSGEVDGLIQSGPFLAEAFRVTRWFIGRPQFTSLTARSIGLVVPKDSDLPAAPRERELIMGLPVPAITEIPAEYLALRKALSVPEHDVLHFSGHGEAQPGDVGRSAMVLEQDQLFLPEDLTGAVANFGKKRPIVFLNACEIGRGGLELGSQAGWPLSFVNAGAGAFIGALWKVADGTAASFAKTFYQSLLTKKETVGEAVHAARLAVRKASDPTWLAYVVYAHPSARVKATA